MAVTSTLIAFTHARNHLMDNACNRGCHEQQTCYTETTDGGRGGTWTWVQRVARVVIHHGGSRGPSAGSLCPGPVATAGGPPATARPAGRLAPRGGGARPLRHG